MLPWLHSELEYTQQLMGTNLGPYGIDANRHVLEAAICSAYEQGLIREQFTVQDLFPVSTHEEFLIEVRGTQGDHKPCWHWVMGIDTSEPLRFRLGTQVTTPPHNPAFIRNENNRLGCGHYLCQSYPVAVSGSG